MDTGAQVHVHRYCECTLGAYTQAHTHTNTHSVMHSHTYTQAHIYTNTHSGMHSHTYTQANTFTHASMHNNTFSLHAQLPTCMHTYTPAYMRTKHTHACIKAYSSNILCINAVNKNYQYWLIVSLLNSTVIYNYTCSMQYNSLKASTNFIYTVHQTD